MDPLPSPPEAPGAPTSPFPPKAPRPRRWPLPVAIVAGILVLALAWYLLANGGGSGPEQPSVAASAPEPVAPMPTNLKATAGPFAVVLRWREGTGGTVDVSRYTLTRDGHAIGLAPE